ncbi:P-loop containing nucleoside triphosphate hydrolase protein [Endogone sp. FLAS-F59071]|nr:P-loop containing nucleoside triphosphate hydrolase protein [Endogone sp. FLAS-F59071]|eukprot:RUS16471.1 P-loop containing nucleoside triphosphate hydrolase protein [Endogone sp. FLAS-F59071]
MPERHVVTIGVSGPSSSGKTTLARHLEKILPNAVIVHQDDFFKPESDIPIDPTTKLFNWDCPSALDLPSFVRVLRHVHAEGTLPSSYESKEDRNEPTKNAVAVSEERLTVFRERVREMLGENGDDDWAFVIVDGFMLYYHEDVMRELDARVFVRSSYEVLKRRREARKVYATIEGYWADPPGYFDAIVWPEYLKWNQHLFESADGLGTLHPDVKDLLILDSSDLSVDDIVELSLEAVRAAVERNW